MGCWTTLEVRMAKKKVYKSTGGIYEEGYVRPKDIGLVMPTSRAMSKNEEFEKNGYLYIPNLVDDVKELFQRPLKDDDGNKMVGMIKYLRKDKSIYTPEENQVNGSLAKYNDPFYKELHFIVRKKIEKILGMDLFPTYYYDRFYYAGQQLYRHSDRPSCEVSVTIQISSNGKEPWPIWFQRPDGSEHYVLMEDGDGAVYKGCEREHWRDPLVSRYNKVGKLWRTFHKKEDDTYHHQIFLHYVNAQGPFIQYAFDR